MLLPLLYNAPVSYYSVLTRYGEDFILEQYDNYLKQTYRNRCRILGANGVIDLVIPVIRKRGMKTKMKDIRLDNDSGWNRIHWRSLFSAYASAPFFEFYVDDIHPAYEKNYRYLVDLNLYLLESTLKALQWNGKVTLSTSYAYPDPDSDLRESIHPKKDFYHTHYSIHPLSYNQVFSEKYPFIPDLSILDLLFNEGPNARSVLKESISVIE